jgi:ABC-type lipoprotein export system ATPase subunit
MEPIIKLNKVNFYYHYGQVNEVHVLKDVSFEIYPGEFVSIFGPSGCGKSTLLYVLAGIEKPQNGEVIVSNKNLINSSKDELAVFRQIAIGLVFQNFNLIPTLKIIENVMLPMAFIGITEEKRQERALNLLDRLGIANLKDRYPSELSGGQQQRVAIARALANDPPIILADEPTGNLDSKNAKNVLDILKEINITEKRTIIMVTHQAWTLPGYVNKIIYLKDGNVVKIEEIEKTKIGVRKINGSYFWENLFPKMPPIKIFIPALAHLLLKDHTKKEINRLSKLIEKRIRREIDEQKFIEFLDKPYSEGGVGLWKHRAEKIAHLVEDALYKRKEVKKLYKHFEENPMDPMDEELEKIVNWFIGQEKISLTLIQKIRLKEILYERLRNMITQDSFMKILDMPLSKGGVGLRVQSALKLSEKIEDFMKTGILI